MSAESSRKVVYAALAGNLLIAVVKFGAALWTGSSAMLSEAVHSVADTGNQALLLYGMRRARLPPDAAAPFGHGRELYFWSFIVALLLFSLGAGVSLYEGVTHLLHPVEIMDACIAFIVLGASFLFEVGSWTVAWREFRATHGDGDILRAVRRSKDPPTFIVLFEDSAAIIGIVLAAAGTAAAVYFRNPLFDGVASICIGLLLAATATFLARESKSLLIGEPASGEARDSMRRIVEQTTADARLVDLKTFQIGPDRVIATLAIDFPDDRRVGAIEAELTELERRLKAAHPELVALFSRPVARVRADTPV